MGRKVKLAKIAPEEDAEITRSATEDPDSAEWTEADFREARPVTDFPELAEILRKAGKLGRPPLPEDQRKLRVTLYLDRDIVDRLKADGRGWQTRANAALRKALGL
jgi:uncharacterized protein (DUF4415 family)